MTTFIRKNAWSHGGTFNNPDLLWYAKGVAAMMALPLDNPNSWWFFAAIHGDNLTSSTVWGTYPAPPNIPSAPLPAPKVRALYWKQCQHGTWYFAPWHRGYLYALEAQIRAAVIALQGPATWALPYWNYFGPGSEYKIPPAFTQRTLPDGSTPNPLFVTARYGPRSDGAIFVPIPPASQDCLGNNLYTGSNAATPRPGFGGPKTGFSHSGRTFGNLENNPHNLVHDDVGGSSPDGQIEGLMSSPATAGLDPIFYLHHANIDRMWAIWNLTAGNPNPTDPNWLAGPAAHGLNEFIMPMPGAVPWGYTPAQVNSLSLLNYTYDDLAMPATVARTRAANSLVARVSRLTAAPARATPQEGAKMDTATGSELVGAHDGALTLTSEGARATVKLDPQVRDRLSANLTAASLTAPPDRTYLQLENVRGTRDANKLAVSINGYPAGVVGLFGLSAASQADGEHGGSGLTFEMDVTTIIDTLHVNKELEAASLDVRIVPSRALPQGTTITVGRVSLQRETHQ